MWGHLPLAGDDRRARLVTALTQRGLAGVVITTLVNVRYLTGFTGSNGALLVPREGPAVFFTDGRYRDQATEELPDLEHVIRRDLVAAMAEQVSDGRWGVETHALSVDGHARLAPGAAVGPGPAEEDADRRHNPTDRVLKSGDFMKADFGARIAGYHADCTRTVVLGRADDWQREVYSAVQESQAAGLELLRDGVAIADSDAAARGSLERSGWLEAFTTGLGHGVGLEIHEDPFIAAQHTGKLVSRTVLTMEPGIYVPGRGGVRIEDTAIVTTGAPEVLTTMTKDLMEIG